MQALALAIGFLTIVPVPGAPAVPRPSTFAWSVALFPPVGALLGALLVAVDALAGALWPVTVASAVTLGVAVFLTGALHLDGFLDTCDGLFLWRADRRLEVMRDSRVGGYAVAGGLALYGLKLTSLAAIAGPARLGALILVPLCGRLALVLTLASFRYARTSGAGNAFKDPLRQTHVLVAIAIAIAGAAAWGPAGLALLALGALFALALGRAISVRLGGLTGDTYGFICECVETALLLGAASPLGAHLGWLRW